MPHKYNAPRDTARELINMRASLERAVVDEESDLVRVHLNNALGTIVGLQESLKAEKALVRPDHA